MLIFFYLQALTLATASNISYICKRRRMLVQFKSRVFSFHHQPPLLYFLCYQMLERESQRSDCETSNLADKIRTFNQHSFK